MPLEKGGGSNGSRHCGKNSSRLCSYIRAFCASFSFFLPLFKFHMEVCMFIEINASKVYFYYVGKKRKKKERQLVI